MQLEIYSAIVGGNAHRPPLSVVGHMDRRFRVVIEVDLFDPRTRRGERNPDLGLEVREVQQDDHTFGGLSCRRRRLTAVGNQAVAEVVRVVEIMEITSAA